MDQKNTITHILHKYRVINKKHGKTVEVGSASYKSAFLHRMLSRTVSLASFLTRNSEFISEMPKEYIFLFV